MERIFRILLSNRISTGVTSVQQVCSRVDRQLRQTFGRESSTLAFSRTFPCLSEDYFIPKPAVITEGLLNLSLKDHKYHRFMRYLRLTELADYYVGKFDFAANAAIRFGSYRKDNCIDTFTFCENAGLYVIVHTAEQLSAGTEEQICLALTGAVECGPAQAEMLELDPLWCELLAPSTSPVISLNDLDVTAMTIQQMQPILEQASFDAAGAPDGEHLVLRAGAVFPCRANVPAQLLCANILRSST